MWEWMMKPRDCPSDKCEIVQGCGRKTQLPGYRFPAFDAYRFFVYIINRLVITPITTVISNPLDDSFTLFKADLTGTAGAVTTYWGYYSDNYYREDIDSQHESQWIASPDPTFEKAYVYNAVGEYLEELDVQDNKGFYYVAATVSTSPRYLSWDEKILGLPEDTVDNYSEVAFVTNTETSAEGVADYKFDSSTEEVWAQTTPFASYSYIAGLAWLDEPGRLLVACNDGAGVQRLLKLRPLDGYYDIGKDIDIHGIDNSIREIRGIATNYLLTAEGQVSEVIHAIVDKGSETVPDYRLDTYYNNGSNWVMVDGTGSLFDYCIDIPDDSGTAEQIRLDELWDPANQMYHDALYVSTAHKILFSIFDSEGGFKELPGSVYIDDFTVEDTNSSYSGFGFALDGHLYIADNGQGGNRIRKYLVGKTGSGPPYHADTGSISINNGEPVGLRITPFGTLGIAIDFDPGGGAIVEYVNDENGNFTLTRTIVDISSELVPGDLEYSYNR